jgi:N-hydroxyarylamine O-acetyltransferase
LLQSRHLACIPFENLSQHGANHAATLNVHKTAEEILDQKRGGFCFELNGLFATLLKELGYKLTLVPAIVYAGDDVGFRHHPTHLILMVKCQDNDALYYSDVGFGEPPLHPLRYNFDCEQVTPESMTSKFVMDNDDVTLYWLKDGEWKPRLQWSYQASLLGENGPELSAFEDALSRVLQPDSIFSQKLICCLLTGTSKLTLAGHKLKITKPRQFPSQLVEPKVEEVESEEQARQLLQDRFGIPLASSHGLDLNKSIHADPSIWSHQ